MAGKSKRGKNRRNSKAANPPESSVSEPVSKSDPHGKETETGSSVNEPKQGSLHLYPVSIKTLNGLTLELQLSPAETVMDIRQFLLDAHETCFFTCYYLYMCTKDGLTHKLEDHIVISKVTDITAGSCSLEMVAAYYDNRSIRAHVQRARELISLSTLHASLSTSLASEYERAQKRVPRSDTAKTEIPELDGLGFMKDETGSLGKLIPSPSEEIKCVESISFSSFNPPPSYRRIVGDLIYLDVVTLEGNNYCVTGTKELFYVNSSTGNVLDPRLSKATSKAATLIGLLQKISPKFRKAFRDILERKASAHPFENVHCLLPPNSWLGSYPVPDDRRDSARAEEALTLPYGSQLITMQRDWNEELQSCREFPHTTPKERMLRDRALYKVSSDFVNAATIGAVGVLSGWIPPINPTDPECLYLYVRNSIFFSFAVDEDLEQLPKKHKIDKNSKTHSGASSETQLVESERATYASTNNDLKGTKAYQEADVPGLHILPMALIDYKGHRVVAQSLIPGILEQDKSDSHLYGSIDNGKTICWNGEFHSKVLEASKRLHLKEHTVVDESGNAFKLASPVESKGVVGSDDRHYLLDLVRVTPRDANYTGPGSRSCILRPELITAFCQCEAAKKNSRYGDEAHATTISSASAGAEDHILPKDGLSVSSDSNDMIQEKKVETVEETPTIASPELREEILLNPNVLTEFNLSGSPEEIMEDEENVRKASSFLADTVLPKFIQDLCAFEVSHLDGQSLTESMHEKGINVRYIGKVAEGTKHFPHLWDVCYSEIVVRSAKHIFKDVLRATEDQYPGPAILHFFNCFFGNCHGSSGKSSGQTRSKRATERKNLPWCMNVNSESIWSDIKDFAKIKYQYELPKDARTEVKRVSVLRNFCLKVGVKIAARKYDLKSATPFQVSDILDLQPVVKHSIPVCSDAKELVEAGKIELAEDRLTEAYTLFSEAFSLLQQVTGPMHPEVANCCRYLAAVLTKSGDTAGAIIQQHKELIINERCLGLDHHITAHSYANIAVSYQALSQTELAFEHMSRALLLLSLSAGPNHPDIAATFFNLSMMYKEIGQMNTSLRYLQEALKLNERLLGTEHIQTATCYHALAIACSLMGALKLSIQHEKKSYDILVKRLGEEHSRTRESLNLIETFKKLELEKQLEQDVEEVSGQEAIDLLKANPDVVQALKAAVAADNKVDNEAKNV